MVFFPSTLKRHHLTVSGHASGPLTLSLAATYVYTFPTILCAQSFTATTRCL